MPTLNIHLKIINDFIFSCSDGFNIRSKKWNHVSKWHQTFEHHTWCSSLFLRCTLHNIWSGKCWCLHILQSFHFDYKTPETEPSDLLMCESYNKSKKVTLHNNHFLMLSVQRINISLKKNQKHSIQIFSVQKKIFFLKFSFFWRLPTKATFIKIQTNSSEGFGW